MGDFNFENRNISVTSLPGSPAQDGTDVTGVSQQTGGAGIRGWLSGIYNLLFSGNAKVQLIGSILAEQKTHDNATSNVITFSANIYAIEIYHESATWQTFVVNGITLKIPASGYRTPIAGTPGLTVTIPAELSCIVGRLV